MKRYLITSTNNRFTGAVEIIYDADGLLRSLDFKETNCDIVFRHEIKNRIATRLENISKHLPEDVFTITDAEFEFTHEDFLREYPYSRNKHLVPAYWEKMPKADRVLAYFAAIEYRKYCERNDWFTPKIADTWLRKKEFLNDWKKM